MVHSVARSNDSIHTGRLNAARIRERSRCSTISQAESRASEAGSTVSEAGSTISEAVIEFDTL